jgi:hypothetical protein
VHSQENLEGVEYHVRKRLKFSRKQGVGAVLVQRCRDRMIVLERPQTRIGDELLVDVEEQLVSFDGCRTVGQVSAKPEVSQEENKG